MNIIRTDMLWCHSYSAPRRGKRCTANHPGHAPPHFSHTARLTRVVALICKQALLLA